MSTVTFGKKPAGFEKLPEGNCVLHISKVQGLPRAGVKTVTMEMRDSKGRGFYGQYPQKYDLTLDGGYTAFYYLVKNGLGVDLNEGDEFNLDDLEGAFVEVEIVHKEGTKAREDGTFPIFANIKSTVGPGKPFAVESAEPAGDEDDEDDD